MALDPKDLHEFEISHETGVWREYERLRSATLRKNELGFRSSETDRSTSAILECWCVSVQVPVATGSKSPLASRWRENMSQSRCWVMVGVRFSGERYAEVHGFRKEF
jgi:hypothetical protein